MPLEHKATEFGYGDAVLYEENGRRVIANVVQSHHVDSIINGQIVTHEELVLVYLDPAKAQPMISNADLDKAWEKRFGVKERTATVKNGFVRCEIKAIESSEPEAEHPAELTSGESASAPEQTSGDQQEAEHAVA